MSAGVAETNPDLSALWGATDTGAQLMGIRHLQWIEEQASFAAFHDERGHEQLSERTGVALRRRYRSHDSICDDGQVRLAEGQEPRGALNDCYDIPRVDLRRRHVRVWVSFAVAVSLVGLGRHIWLAVTTPDERSVQVLWSAGFAWMGVQWVLSWLDKPRQVTERQQRQLDGLKVTVNIPLYNEDPTLVDRVLYALSRQTRQADRIEVVDDGSTVDYAVVRGWWEEQFGSRLSWIRQANGGKKHAQVRTFRSESPSDIIVTIDSDTALEERALEEGLKPFADPRVQSVAGMETAANSQVNWLTRTASVRSLFFQLTACGVLSAFGEILTNRGAFALYRASLLREIADVYVGETFLGHRIRLGDDAALTLFAHGRRANGAAVFRVVLHDVPREAVASFPAVDPLDARYPDQGLLAAALPAAGLLRFLVYGHQHDHVPGYDRHAGPDRGAVARVGSFRRERIRGPGSVGVGDVAAAAVRTAQRRGVGHPGRLAAVLPGRVAVGKSRAEAAALLRDRHLAAPGVGYPRQG